MGARRCHDLEEKTCILPNFGSGPDNSTAGTGYYSTEDYREILRHAKELHIQVIPEFDFPGHSHAAINSMFVRHNKQAQQGEGTENFLLNDLEDTSRYSSLEGFSNDAINPCLSSTYRFLDHLLSELTRLHVDTQPLRLFHLGGDEVPLGVWMDSPACRNVTRKIARDEYFVRKHLMQKFITKLSRITKEHGAAIGGWSDAFVGQREDTEFSEMQDRYVLSRQSLNSDPVAYFWGGEDQFWKVFALMGKGYKVRLNRGPLEIQAGPGEIQWILLKRPAQNIQPNSIKSKDCLVNTASASFCSLVCHFAREPFNSLVCHFARLLCFSELGTLLCSTEHVALF